MTTSFTPRTPTWADVFKAATDARLQDLHVALPGRVESFDATKQLADVQPLLLVPLTDENGTQTTARLPVIPSVPVVYPRGSGFHLVFPLAVGDNVLVVFTERSLDVWKGQGGEVNPIDSTYHGLSGAVCYPGLYPTTNPVPSFPTNKLVVGKDGVPHAAAARNGDSVKVTLTALGTGTMAALAATIAPLILSAAPGLPCAPNVPAAATAPSFDITGTITSGSANVEIAN